MTSVVISQRDPVSGELVDKSLPLLGVMPLEVYFRLIDLEFTPYEYLWDFGDGTTSSKANPVHLYNTYGYHKIFVFIRNYGGSFISVSIPNRDIILGKLDFSGIPRSGDKPLSVQFDLDSIAPTGCQFTGMLWDFGDSIGATGMQGPLHPYSGYGAYSVGIDAVFGTV
jgi:PKD repeat protein